MADHQIIFPVLHFNDVYNMTIADGGTKPDNPRRIVSQDGKLTNRSFDHVIAFAQKIDDVRNRWDIQAGRRQGLLLFSGDLFSPSVESSVTLGSNMVHLMNQLEPDACVPGNHEFDHGVPRFNQLAEFCTFPWILSNVEYPPEQAEGPSVRCLPKNLQHVLEYTIRSQKGLKIGIIGLMSKDTLEKTNTESRKALGATDMTEACKKLATRLRQDKKCDLIVAPTHALDWEDEALSKAVGAVQLGSKYWKDSLDQVDIIFGGHEHQGVEQDGRIPDDKGSYIVKSGTDFEDLSEVEIIAIKQPAHKVHNTVVTSVKVVRHRMKHHPKDVRGVDGQGIHPPMARILQRVYDDEVIRTSDTQIALLQQDIDMAQGRDGETVIGNWVADSLLEWYRHLVPIGEDSPHALILNQGSIRGEKSWKQGPLIPRQVIELIPFNDNLTMANISGEDLTKALDSALSESRFFPAISGMRIEWNSSSQRQSKRVTNIYFLNGEEELKLELGSKYCILTSAYLAEGNNGFEEFQKQGKSYAGFANIPMHQALRYHISDLAQKQSRAKVDQEMDKLREEVFKRNKDIDEAWKTEANWKEKSDKLLSWIETQLLLIRSAQSNSLAKIDFEPYSAALGNRMVKEKNPVPTVIKE